MYTRERAEGWMKRSLSPEYQKAYDKIAFYAGRNLGRVVDFGFGTGEMMKRVYRKSSLILGIDSCRLMLCSAKENIEAAGIQAHTLESPEDVTCYTDGAFLVEADMMKSYMSEGFFDVALYTFPEVFGNADYGDIEPRLRESIARSVLMGKMSDTLKPGGKLIMAKYDERDNRHINGVCEDFRDLFGFEVLRQDFFGSRVHIDTDGPSSDPEYNLRGKGYRIFRMRKIE